MPQNQTIQQIKYFLVAYITDYVVPTLKEILEATKNFFVQTLWDRVKNEFTVKLKEAIELASSFLSSKKYEEKEKIILDLLFQKVKLPLYLRPFKSIVRKVLKKKIKTLISESLKRLDAVV